MSKFARFRAEFNLTQEELARLLGVKRNTVTRWEIGLVKPPKVAELALEGLRVGLAKRKKQGRKRG